MSVRLHANAYMVMHRYIPYLWLLLILLFAFALRMWHLNTESIWHDEAWSIRAFRGPFTTPDDNTPYLYYLSGHLLWRFGGGETPLALRYVSVLIGTLTVALTMRIGAWWMNWRVGLFAGLMVAASPLLWEYAQEVRAYVAVPLLALALLAVAERILCYGRGDAVPRRLWLVAFAVQLAGIYTHNLTVPLVVWLNVALGLVWLLRRDWRKMLNWAGVEIALILAYIPWLTTQSPSGTPLNTPPEVGLALVRDVWLSYFLPVLLQVQHAIAQPEPLATALNVLGVVLVVLVGIAIGITLISRKPSGQPVQLWLLVSHMLLVPMLSTALMLAANIDFHPRYYIAAVPGTLLLLAVSLQIITRSRIVLLTELVTLGVVALSILSLHDIRTTRTYQHDDFAGLAEYYATLPPEAVILIPFDAERAIEDYYAEKANIQAQIVNIPLYSDEATAVETINALIQDDEQDDERLHIELLTWFQLPADARGMYDCLLSGAHRSEAEITRQNYFGLNTVAYRINAITMQPLDLSASFGNGSENVRLRGATYANGNETVCLRTEWELMQPLTADYKASGGLLAPTGNSFIGGADNVIARPDNVGMRHWAVGEIGQAYTLIPAEAGVPLDDYDLTISIYSEDGATVLDLLNEDGAPVGQVLRVEEALRVSGPRADDPEVPVLLDDSTRNAPLRNGDRVSFKVLLPADEAVTLTLGGDDWQLESEFGPHSKPRLVWPEFAIPVDAGGAATLRVTLGGFSAELAQYPIEFIPRLLEAPDYSMAVDGGLPGVAQLVGATLPELPISADASPEVTLIWRGTGENTLADYTVFVQLLTADGRLLAQSDALPPRRTSTWIDGEYIVDTHTLRFNPDMADYTGVARLMAGMYGAWNFERVSTDDGSDAILISDDIEIE